MADTKKIITIMYRLFFFKSLGDINLSTVNNKIIIGNWKANPKIKASFKDKEIYSLILGSNSIV